MCGLCVCECERECVCVCVFERLAEAGKEELKICECVSLNLLSVCVSLSTVLPLSKSWVG